MLAINDCSLAKTVSLVTSRRFDLAVKFSFFHHLLHGDDYDSERVYRWHIEKRSGHRMESGVATDGWKRSLDDYVASAASLAASMAHRGFLPHGAVPVDPNGELLGGVHRVACAIACGIDAIPVVRMESFVWAHPWDRGWFIGNGESMEDLVFLDHVFENMTSNGF